MLAAQQGRLDTVRELLEQGAFPNLHEKGHYTALMLAASNDHHRVVRLLSEYGAGVNERERTQGWTALIWAAKRGHRQTVQTLLELGADRSIADNRGRTAATWAHAHKQEAVVAMLADENGLREINAP
jgi:ankyrin repeat protein